MNITQLSQEVIASVKSYIDSKIDVYNLKFGIFEDRIKTLKDGRDGRDGRDGKDAFDIKVLDEIDDNVEYTKGTFAQHKNGLYYATDLTNGMEGWKCLISGISEISVDISEDMRNVSIKTVKSTGETIEKSFNIPAMIYRGVFDQKEKYAKGDCVTYSGSMWVSKSNDNEFKPGDSDTWQLSVKRGSK